MFDTMRLNKSRLVVSAMTLALIFSGLQLPFAGKARTRGRVASRSASATARKGKRAAPAPPALQSVSYNKVLQDDSTGDLFRFNSTTGDYLYSKCGNGFSLSGTGTVSVKGSTYTLTHNPADRRVSAKLDDALHTGSASIQFPPGTTIGTITDRNTTNDPGLADSSPPQVGITAPNGGEILDTGSSFTISWNATDDVGITSQDLLLSTDGGTTWSSIVSGLAGTVNSYSWTVPTIANNQTSRVRLVARDAACNTGVDASDANFTIWNPPASFTHAAEAPFFFAGQGFTSIISMTNTSSKFVGGCA